MNRILKVVAIFVSFVVISSFHFAFAEVAPTLTFENLKSATFDVGKADGYYGVGTAKAKIVDDRGLALLSELLASSTLITDPEEYDRTNNIAGNDIKPFVKREREEMKTNTLKIAHSKGTATISVIRCGEAAPLLVYDDAYFAPPAQLLEFMFMVNGMDTSKIKDTGNSAYELMEAHGLNPLFPVKQVKYTLPNSFVNEAENDIESFYWSQVNALSSAIGLDMSAFAGKEVLADVYPLFGKEYKSENTYKIPYAVVYTVDKQVIGAHVGMPYIRGGESNGLTLDFQSLEDITKGTASAWLGATIKADSEYERATLAMTPLEVADSFIKSITKKDAKLYHSVTTREFAMNALISEAEAYEEYALPTFTAKKLGIPFSSVKFYKFSSSIAEPIGDVIEIPLDATLKSYFPGNPLLPNGEIMRLVLVKEAEGVGYKVNEVY